MSNEIAYKLERIRNAMKDAGAEGVRFKTVDWFAWSTGGGNSVVIFTAEKGIAEVFITADKAMVLTNKIERDRLAQEEIPGNYEIIAFPWQDPFAADKYVAETLKGRLCLSDSPQGNEKPIPNELQVFKMTLSPEEIHRYKEVGQLAAEAMTEAIVKAEPNWTEDQLAGEGAKSLWQRGLDPTLVMVGCHRRIQLHRHPIAGKDRLGDCAMMVFCARGYGLYANLTRFVYFREPTSAERKRIQQVAEVEAAVFAASTDNQTLHGAYEALVTAYKNLGTPEEVDKHHQGGPTGYLSREWIASLHSPVYQKLKTGMALAWNPSLPGAKIEDTVLIGEKKLEILTVDPKWPTFEVAGRARPDVWIKK